MKLSKQQVDALRNRIINDLRKEAGIQNKNIRKAAYKEFLKTPLGKAYKLVSEAKIHSHINDLDPTDAL
jgi:hypothetical protein